MRGARGRAYAVDGGICEAWDRFKDLLRACPHHGFSELHQLDTFYNALNSKDQDSLNSAVGGNFLDKMPHDCLSIIESKSKVHYSCDKPVVAKVSTNASTSGVSPDVAELNYMVRALLLDKKGQNQSHAPVKAVEESCVTCGDTHSYKNYPATDGNSFSDEDISKKIYSNPLFDEEIIYMKINPHHFNAESDLIESLFNHDSSIISSSSKIYSLFDEFAGELTLLKSIPSRINEIDCDPEEETHFIKRLLYDNSSPRPPEEFILKKL
nr:reverse transcriptase domain-containing protein [Tanacetum cinerariifolium]